MAAIQTAAVNNYIQAAHKASMSKSQLELFLRAGYVSLPVMLPFHTTAHAIGTNGVTEILLDGTRGSAKSHAAIAQVGLDDCQREPGVKFLFLRQTERAAGESLTDLIGRVFRGISHKANTERVTFANKSRILIGGYKDESDIDKYIGVEYDGMLIEEASQIPGHKIDMLKGSLRTSRPGWTPRIYYTTNPGGKGHSYFKQRFVAAQRQGKETNTRRYYSSYKDNPFINPEYRLYLESLTGDLARQWRDGDWDIFAGQAFPSWRHDVHVVQPFEILPYWIRVTGTDWGYAKPFSNLWAAKNPDNGRIVIYREAHETNLTDPRQAELIRSMENPGETIRKRYADPSMWTKRTQDSNPTSTADVYASHGIYLTPAANDRIAGKRKVDRLLEPLPDGKPGLLVFSTCSSLISTMPMLTHDTKNPEDIDTDGDDHDYDALRYLLTDDREIKAQPKPPQANPWLKHKDL